MSQESLSQAKARALPSWPVFDGEDEQAVVEVLRSTKVNYWTGQNGKAFENEFAELCGTSHAIAVMNGTVALEMCLESLGIGVGGEVVVTPRTFVASASAIVRSGARPVFADVCPNSGNITAESVEAVLSKRTKAVVIVHLGGWPAEMDEFHELSKQYGIALVEDCAQAHGAQYKGRSVGSFGRISAFSFCQDKIVTLGGEGGMVVTDDSDLWERAWGIKDHGKSYDTVFRKEHPPGFRWLHEDFGSNYRLTEMQSALGRVALQKLAGWVRARRRNAHVLEGVFDKFPNLLRSPKAPDHSYSSYYRLYCYVRPEGLKQGWNRDRIMVEISSRGVPCFIGSCGEIYLEKAFEKYSLRPEKRLPIAKELGETSLCFLVHPTLTSDDVLWMAEVIEDVLSEASL